MQLRNRTGFFRSTHRPNSREPGFLLRFYRFATGEREVIGRINGTLGTGLAVSPDGRWLLFTDYEMPRGDLMLVENFR